MPKKHTRAVGIVVKDEHVLLIHRRIPGKEYWVFPGGGVEVGEEIPGAVLRELKEETSIEAEVDRLLYRHTYPDHGDEHFFYLCTYLSGEPQLNQGNERDAMEAGDDYYDPQWIAVADMPHMLVYPLEIRDWLLSDLQHGLPREPRTAVIRAGEVREAL